RQCITPFRRGEVGESIVDHPPDLLDCLLLGHVHREPPSNENRDTVLPDSCSRARRACQPAASRTCSTSLASNTRPVNTSARRATWAGGSAAAAGTGHSR